MLPLLGLFLATELGFFTLNNSNLLILAGALLVIYIIAFFRCECNFSETKDIDSLEMNNLILLSQVLIPKNCF